MVDPVLHLEDVSFSAAIATPVRLRLSRLKGFNLQAHSRETNGLPAVNVARPSKWGNPFKDGSDLAGQYARVIGPYIPQDALDELRGKNLACYCPLDAECHADVLLELANR